MVTIQQVQRRFKRDGFWGLARTAYASLRHRGVTVDENKIILQRLLSDHQGTMIDVGACHGSALLPFAQRGWQVIGFEPDPVNRKYLLDNIKKLRNVTVHADAVAAVDGQTMKLYASPESPGVSSLTPFLESHKEVAEVKTIRLDTFLSKSDIEKVDYLKVDAEGHDLFVLRTYPFDKYPPKVVLCEFEDRKTLPLGYRMTDMADHLVLNGYEVFISEWHPIKRYGIAHNWNRFARYPALPNADGWGNLIGVHRDSDLVLKAAQAFPEA